MPLKIHFLNVGHGDCTFVDLPSGHLMMIDINNSKSLTDQDEQDLAMEKGLTVAQFKSSAYGPESFANRSWEDYYKSLLVDPIDYYKEHFSGRSIFRYVQTHPDLDHMSGLHRFFWQEKVGLNNFWDTAHKKEFEESDFEGSRFSYLDWCVYTLLRSGVLPNDETVKNLEIYRGDSRNYWNTDNIEILSPTPELIESCNTQGKSNDVSYVLKISYGGRSVILPGDAENEAWNSILNYYDSGELDCDILKASHHGRKSGYHKEAVEEMLPEYVICSVGKKPTTDASAEYAKHGAQVFSTRFNGTIIATIWDDGEVWFDSAARGRIGEIPPII